MSSSPWKGLSKKTPANARGTAISGTSIVTDVLH